MRLPTTILALAALAAPAAAQTQAELNVAAARDYARADAALNRQWKTTFGRLKSSDARGGGHRAHDLLQRQRQWIRSRDAGCAAVGADYAGGSMQGMQIAACKTERTRARTAELRRIR